MKIAIIGTGNVGGTLGRRWAAEGHDVVFAVRDPAKDRIRELLKSTDDRARAALIADAVSEAPVVVLAVPWASAQKALGAAEDWNGKILIDCTNPIKEGLAGLSLGHQTSAGEQVAAWARGAKVVKAFSTTGSGNMQNPIYGAEAASMFICGDDKEARETVSQLAAQLGFDVVDCGALHVSRYLEPLAMLWIHLAYARGYGADIAFRLMRRE